jgi:hypothetical protein
MDFQYQYFSMRAIAPEELDYRNCNMEDERAGFIEHHVWHISGVYCKGSYSV